MPGPWLQVLSLLGALVLPAVSGVEIYTPELVEAVNGSDVRLKCTFTSTNSVSVKAVTVSWNFRPLDQASREESVFHYQEEAYPPTTGRFKDRVVWSGDISNRDASITLQGVPPTFNGTYTCQVRNPPDVHGVNGEIVLKVMDKAVGLSEMALLAAIVGGACAVILLLVVVYVLVKRRRRRLQDGDLVDGDLEMPARKKEWKDPTVCSPSEAVHLTMAAKVVEAESSDDEGSEPSSGDDDEEEDEEEDDDDDDDDEDDDDDDDDDAAADAGSND